MKKNTYPGLFIAFEGLDGSGSSIHASLLAGLLSKEGYRLLHTKEPTNNLIGGLIRAQLTGAWKSSQDCLQLLFAADRAHHLDKEIIPALSNGKIVVIDRYAFSNVAYGSVDLDASTKWLKQINEYFIEPDITFVIKVSPKICALRLKKSRYKMELFSQEDKLSKVWKVYEELIAQNKNVFVINGEQDEMNIIGEILDVTQKYLNEQNSLKNY